MAVTFLNNEDGEKFEKDITNLSEEMADLKEGGKSEPSYVITEANAVIDKIAAAQGNRTFCDGGYHRFALW